MKIIRAMTGAKTEVDWFITLYGNDLRYTKVKLVDRANFRKEFDQEYNIYLLVFSSTSLGHFRIACIYRTAIAMREPQLSCMWTIPLGKNFLLTENFQNYFKILDS